MKHIRNWKVYRDYVSLSEALEILKKGTINGLHPVCIQHAKTHKHIEKYEESLSFSPKELSNEWYILVPDNDEEEKNEKIRTLMKESFCSGLKNDKIDNMTIDEIFEHIFNRLGKDQKYRMLKYYFENKIYKTK